MVLISKPGVPFIDKLSFDEERGYPIYEAPEEYTKRLSLFWRVDAASVVIDNIDKVDHMREVLGAALLWLKEQ